MAYQRKKNLKNKKWLKFSYIFFYFCTENFERIKINLQKIVIFKGKCILLLPIANIKHTTELNSIFQR
jgi:hypothetical protein